MNIVIRIRVLATEVPSESNENERNEIELLLKKWEDEHYKITPMNPIQFLKALMENHEISESDLANLLDEDNVTIIQILNYKHGLSQANIYKLCDRFKMRLVSFNRKYPLI